MSDILIQAENISKKYRLGVLNANTFRLYPTRKRSLSTGCMATA
ncbi:hypothetical protein ACFQRK_13525 [Parapedobacter sp. GCM10030251]